MKLLLASLLFIFSILAYSSHKDCQDLDKATRNIASEDLQSILSERNKTPAYGMLNFDFYQTTAKLLYPENEDSLDAYVGYVCRNNNDFNEHTPLSIVYDRLENISPSKDSGIGRFSNCLMAASLLRQIRAQEAHFGFSLQVDDEMLDNLFGEISNKELKKVKKIIGKLYKRFASDEYHLKFYIHEPHNAVTVKMLTGMISSKIKEDGRLSEVVKLDILNGSYYAAPLGKGSRIEELFDYKDFNAKVFVYYWKKGQQDINKEQFFEKFELERLNPVTIKLFRHQYGEKNMGSPFFHLGMQAGIYNGRTQITKGWVEHENDRDNSSTPSKKTTQWSNYGFGLRSIYPSGGSTLPSLNTTPLASIVTPKIDLRESFSTRSLAYYNLVILRYKGEEYITFEGRPCVKKANEYDAYRCEEPYKPRRFTSQQIRQMVYQTFYNMIYTDRLNKELEKMREGRKPISKMN